ncbi:AbrB/MazE/SpoVT family DNA-binding domain-containing protein [Candidatus Daviesbacteria bacterium]|nr:AbrB/MazE/SpoVT family DNA-binding domain-containing protein [Candidatus Daviesbacteria bacterium]
MQQFYQEEIVKIQPKGLVTIPKKFRNELGFAENSLVRIKEEKGRLVMEAVRTLSYPVRSYTDSEIDQFFELDEKESKDLRKKGLL